jgi:hypothetical protein
MRHARGPQTPKPYNPVGVTLERQVLLLERVIAFIAAPIAPQWRRLLTWHVECEWMPFMCAYAAPNATLSSTPE